jgi:2-polyprenyl-3-methyl-5-hydroxy-6-metoxy-1,4-benzoquinol methylase
MGNWLTNEVQKYIEKEDTILDLGCGIMSVSDKVICKSILALDVWEDYLEKIKSKFMTIKLDVRFLNIFIDKSYDIVMALDLVEHLEKHEAKFLIKQMERIARKKVIIFTPNGFFPQKDGIENTWAYGNPKYQKHKCGFFQDELESFGFKTELFGINNSEMLAVKVLE